MLEITHVQEFAASHRLHDPSLSDAENRELYGICNSPNGHGHNWVVEVTVRGTAALQNGMVMDLNRLSRLVVRRIVEPVDHLHLNHDVPFLAGIIPTAENLAVAFWKELEPELASHAGARLARVRVRESRQNFADYFGEAAP